MFFGRKAPNFVSLFQINATPYHNFDCLRSFRIVLSISHLMCSFLKQSYTDSNLDHILLNSMFYLKDVACRLKVSWCLLVLQSTLNTANLDSEPAVDLQWNNCSSFWILVISLHLTMFSKWLSLNTYLFDTSTYISIWRLTYISKYQNFMKFNNPWALNQLNQWKHVLSF